MEGIKKRLANTELATSILDKFTCYVQIHTTSDMSLVDTQCPTSQGQFQFAEVLKKELIELGITDTTVSEHCYVLGRVPATPGLEQKPPIFFMCHLDTSSDAPGINVKPVVHENYDGKPITLKENQVIDPEIYPHLKECIGDTLITSDGTTLLGADDKAGCAEVMAAITYIIKHDIPHGPLELVFEPDEEIGRNLLEFLPKLESKMGYTIDGSTIGEVSYECFEAFSANVTFQGHAVHTGEAYGKLINANLMASSFLSKLPKDKLPETTRDREGFIAIINMEGAIEEAKAFILLRSFTMDGIEEEKQILQKIAKEVEEEFKGGKVVIEFKKMYRNMKNTIDMHPEVVEILEKALKNAGVNFYVEPIRGGTDATHLVPVGIACPNIFTGSFGHHSKIETAILSEMVAAAETVIEIIKVMAQSEKMTIIL